MTIARKDIIAKGEVASYHLYSRCVRRSFLCGDDPYSGKNYDHRKAWILERFRFLLDRFCIEAITPSIMSNHTHLEIRARPDLAKRLTPKEIALRWLTIFPGRRGAEDPSHRPSAQKIQELCASPAKLEEYRQRLGDPSWFMRCLNEWIARKANREDGVSGRFWEGRFKCQRLYDDAAVLACMAYIDLNPVRAQVASTPEESLYTGARERIVARQARAKVRALAEERKKAAAASAARTRPPLSAAQVDLIREQMAKRHADEWLCPLEKRSEVRLGAPGRRGVLPITTDEYLELLEWTGREIRAGKRGAIPPHLAPILERLSLDVTRWVETVERFGSLFWRAVGRVEALVVAARRAGRRWFKGLRACERAFSPKPG